MQKGYHNFTPGDYVQLLHTEPVGEIMAIQQGKATIRFEYATVTVSLQAIQPANTSPSKKSSNQPSTYARKNSSSFDVTRFVNFKPELDLHGLKISDAIQALDKWIDLGLLAGHHHLRIIHGKGKGVLRQEVHQYLKTNELVRKIIDNHQFAGGSGVTYIEL